MDGIGPDRAESIATWFADEKNHALVAELRELGLRLELARRTPEEGPLTGNTYVVTGRSRAGRANRRPPPSRRGRKGHELGLGQDDGVIVGEEPGLEADEGAALGVELLDEAALEKLL